MIVLKVEIMPKFMHRRMARGYGATIHADVTYHMGLRVFSI